MTLSESGSKKTWKSSVANEPLAKFVMACLRGIGFFSRVKMTWKLDEVHTACQFFLNLKHF